jgi:hypothetical protein
MLVGFGLVDYPDREPANRPEVRTAGKRELGKRLTQSPTIPRSIAAV